MKIIDTFHIPLTPNFLRFKNSENATYPIHRLTDKEIKEIGALWTAKLLERARQNRKTQS